MKLFTFATSPYARKVRIVLDYKGIPYEPIERCYSLDRKEDLRMASKRAEVPAIILDDTPITEFIAVCQLPGMDPAKAYRSLELFGKEILPAIKDGTA